VRASTSQMTEELPPAERAEVRPVLNRTDPSVSGRGWVRFRDAPECEAVVEADCPLCPGAVPDGFWPRRSLPADWLRGAGPVNRRARLCRSEPMRSTSAVSLLVTAADRPCSTSAGAAGAPRFLVWRVDDAEECDADAVPGLPESAVTPLPLGAAGLGTCSLLGAGRTPELLRLPDGFGAELMAPLLARVCSADEETVDVEADLGVDVAALVADVPVFSVDDAFVVTAFVAEVAAFVAGEAGVVSALVTDVAVLATDVTVFTTDVTVFVAVVVTAPAVVSTVETVVTTAETRFSGVVTTPPSPPGVVVVAAVVAEAVERHNTSATRAIHSRRRDEPATRAGPVRTPTEYPRCSGLKRRSCHPRHASCPQTREKRAVAGFQKWAILGSNQ
jgi:hypothetical protein